MTGYLNSKIFYVPIVDINVVLKLFSENLKRIQVFPTPVKKLIKIQKLFDQKVILPNRCKTQKLPLSPIRRSLNR